MPDPSWPATAYCDWPQSTTTSSNGPAAKTSGHDGHDKSPAARDDYAEACTSTWTDPHSYQHPGYYCSEPSAPQSSPKPADTAHPGHDSPEAAPTGTDTADVNGSRPAKSAKATRTNATGWAADAKDGRPTGDMWSHGEARSSGHSATVEHVAT